MTLKKFPDWTTRIVLGIFWALLVGVKFWDSLISKEKLFWGEDFTELAGMREHFYHQLQKGSLYLWDYLITTGMPYLGADSGVFYPIDFIIGLMSDHYFVPLRQTLLHVFHFWLAGLFTYLYARQIGLYRTPAIISSMIFMLGGFMLGHMGHRNIIQTIIWFPLGLYFLEKALSQRRMIWAVSAGGVLAVSFLAGHANIFYFIILFIVMYYFFRIYLGIREKSFKAIYQDTFYFSLAGLFLLGISALQLLPSLEGSLGSYQASLPYGWKAMGSFPFFNLIHFLFSDFNHWGTSDPGEHYSYVGVLPIFLSLWAIIRSKDTRTRFFGLVILFSLIIAFGDNTPLYKFFFEYLPGISLFRIPARINCLVVFSLAVLAGIGAQQFLNAENDKFPRTWKSLEIIFYLFGGIGILIVIYLGYFLLTDRASSVHQLSDVWKHLSQGILIFLFVWTASYLLLRVRIKWGANGYIKLALILLIAGDLVFERIPQVKLTPISQTAWELAGKLKKDRDLFRVDNQEGVLPRYLRYQKDIPTYDQGSAPDYASRLIPDESLKLIFYSSKNPMLRDLLNVKYYIGSHPVFNRGWEKIIIGGTFENDRELILKDSTRISRLECITFLSHSVSIPQGGTVAQLVLINKEGPNQIIPIRAGVETAEWAIDRPGLTCLHRKALVKESWKIGREGYQGHSYVFTVNFPQPKEVSRILLRYQAREGDLLLKQIGVNDRPIEDVLKDRFQQIEPYVYLNPSWLPRVFMIGKAREITNKDEMLEHLAQLNPREVVLLSKLPPGYREPLNSAFAADEAQVLQYTSDRIEITTRSSENKFLVLSDTYNRYWKATIDRIPSPVLKVNYGLRGLYVPKGNHRIEFTFHCYSFYYGLLITSISLAGVILVFLWRYRRKSFQGKRPSEDLYE